MAEISGLHRTDQRGMVLALEALRIYQEHSEGGDPEWDLAAQMAHLFGRVAGSLPTADEAAVELRQLTKGLLDVGRFLSHQIADDEHGTVRQVLEGCQAKVERARLLD